MSEQDWSKLKRPRYSMPADVREALETQGLMAAYTARPPYQQNDYIGWINRAKRLKTRAKRLGQMLAELQQGDVYMKMDWNKSKKKAQR